MYGGSPQVVNSTAGAPLVFGTAYNFKVVWYDSTGAAMQSLTTTSNVKLPEPSVTASIASGVATLAYTGAPQRGVASVTAYGILAGSAQGGSPDGTTTANINAAAASMTVSTAGGAALASGSSYTFVVDFLAADGTTVLATNVSAAVTAP